MNAVEIEEAVSALAEAPFDANEFPYAFLEAFGNKATTLKRLRAAGKGSTNKSDLSGGVLQRNNIHLAVCAAGKVAETLKALVASPATAKQKAKFALATDGKTIEAQNLVDEAEPPLVCDYADLGNHFGYFLALAGISTVRQIRENAFDIKATGRLNRLYVELLRHNPEWGAAERREDLNHFFARLIFCFFAEDTGIFRGDGLFHATIQQMTDPDGSNTAWVLSEIFRAMDTKPADRAAGGFRAWADQFPYVNGGLFAGAGGERDVPAFSKIARSYLLHVGGLDWTKINPDIFGSMIQAVADDEERGALGMHYTSVPNILKVLNPLFLDDLRSKLDEAGDGSDPGSRRKLLNLRNRIARIRVFDPACGSGNFLVIAYKQMREIEAEINRRRGEADRRSDIPLTNFRGIELRHFACEVARLALVIAEYQSDVLYRGAKLALAEFLPLDAENWITHGNALRLDWLSVCPPSGTGVKVRGDDLFETPLDQPEMDFENTGGETFICGNPPYLGSTWQSKDQKADLKAIFESRTKSWKSLDYVSAWFMKAADYGRHNDSVAAFVATNSICQGQHVPAFWPSIIAAGQKIAFAHTSFKWSNLAKNKAGVVVIIVGLSRSPKGLREIYSLDDDGEVTVKLTDHINAYLVPYKDIIVTKRSIPLCADHPMDAGGKPVDGGNLLLSAANRRELLAEEPRAERFLLRAFGADECTNGKIRYCLWIADCDAQVATAWAPIADRLHRVASMRSESPKPATREMARRPHRFDEVKQKGTEEVIFVPASVASSREYIHAGLLPAGSIVTNLGFALYDVPHWSLALLNSRMHFIWVATICGKFKEDYRYSTALGWNTFPIPPLSDQNKADLTRRAEEILLAREAHWPATIADLYDPEKMPEDLREAHDRNDETLERIYIGRRFKNDTERLETLFEMYTAMTAKEGSGKKPAKRKTKGAET